MPIFKSEDEEVKVHERYHIDTDREGKFTPTHNGWLRTQKILDWIPDTFPFVLGVGCNSGGLERTILRYRKGSSVYGVDVNGELVKLACMKGVIAKTARGESLPFNDGFFDVVVLSEVLEHVFDVDVVLNEAKRVLKTGGLVIGSVPHPKGLNAKKGFIDHPYHARIFTPKELRNNLSKHFNNITTDNVSFAFDSSAPSCMYDNPQWICFKGVK